MSVVNYREVKTCGHAITEAPGALCEVCRVHLCDDCWGIARVCCGCGGAICSDCALKVVTRARNGVVQYLAPNCHARELKARSALLDAIGECSTAIAAGLWSDVAIERLQAGIRIASRDGSL